MIYENQEALDTGLAKWQKALRLADWDIAARIVRRDEIGEDKAGSCSICLSKKEAFIFLLDPIDFPPDVVLPQCHELTLIHELIHLHFEPVADRIRDHIGEDKEDAFYIPMEQLVESLAKSIVAVSRGT